MPQTELFSGGLVTSRDASLLEPGELSVAEDVQLQPASPSLFKAPGRALFNSTALSATIDGLAYCVFDGASDKLAAVSGGSYYTATAASTGAPTSLATGAGNSLTSVSMNNRSALLSGGTNRVLLSDGTSRLMGLAPVTSPPGLNHSATGGTWPLGATQLGWFEYWTTEVYKTTTEEVESTYTGTITQVNVTAAASYVTIFRPSPVNSDATHWRVYRALKKTAATDAQQFPIGFRIAEVPVATATFSDGISTTTTLTLAGAGDNTITASNGTAGDWTSPSNITADDAAVATSAAVSMSALGVVTRSAMRAGTFGFSGIGNPITDVTVTIEGKCLSAFVALQVSLSWDGGTNWTAAQTMQFSTSAFTIVSKGGLWGRAWSSAEFTNALFFVRLEAYGTIVAASTIEVDYVKASVTHGGTTAEQAVEFPRIIISAGPLQGSIGANGKPPSATTGDIFQGALVINDVSNPRQIAWTIPGTLDYSPAIYRMAFELPVRRIATLGNILVVGQSAQLEGLRFLPLEDDSEFNTGRARFPITTDDGIVTPAAACKFTIGGQQRLFFAGYSQLMMTDGFTAEPATHDINWNEMVDPMRLFNVHAVKNARYREIKVHYPSRGGIDKTLVLSYDPVHLKNGKLKVVGITNYAASCSTEGTFDDTNEPVVFTGRSTGFIYLENRGYSSAAGNTIIPKVSTREMHQAGFGSAWELPSLGIHHQDNGAAEVDVSFTATQANNPSRTSTTHTFTADDRQLSIIDGGEAGEGIIVNLLGRDDGLPLTLDYLVLNAQGLGDTMTLKS